MREDLRTPGVEQKPPILLRNALLAYGIALIVDWRVGKGFSPEGHKLLRQLVVKTWKGTKVSIAREVSRTYQGADLTIEVDGQEHIPASGPTIFIANHTRGGPLDSIGQFFEMMRVGYDARLDVEDDEIREPFLIVQRGLAKGKIVQYLSGIFYDIVGNSLGCEIVAIPRYNKDGEIINGQNLKPGTIRRIVDGGSSLWLPQGRHRDPDDLRFPEKATGFLKKINRRDRFTQLVPVRSVPDSHRNIKIVFGPAVEISHVVANGGINYFAQNHIAPLR